MGQGLKVLVTTQPPDVWCRRVLHKGSDSRLLKMTLSAHRQPSRDLRRALKGAMCMAQDRGYVQDADNPLLKAPPTSAAAFLRAFPAHFDVTDRLRATVIRFEFWHVPLDCLPGRPGQLVARRARRAARDTGVATAMVRLVLLVPQYTRQQEARERAVVKALGVQLEVFPHHFFARVSQLHRLPHCELLRDAAMLERFQNMYGTVANLPKISSEDFICRYLGAAPGDILLSGGSGGGMRGWRLVVPTRRPADESDHTGELQRRVAAWRDARLSFRDYLSTISEDPNYY